jgi:hypothetical protein
MRLSLLTIIFDNDSAMTDHFNGCCICNTKSSKCSSSAGAHAVGKAFLDFKAGEEDEPQAVGAASPLVVVAFLLLEDFLEGDNDDSPDGVCLLDAGPGFDIGD